MFVLGLVLLVLFPAARAPELRPPAVARTRLDASAHARPAGRRPTPAVFHRRVTRPPTSVAGDRSALSGPLSTLIDPPRPQRLVMAATRPGPFARGADTGTQRGPPLRAR
jgi:hypothetical protein